MIGSHLLGFPEQRGHREEPVAALRVEGAPANDRREEHERRSRRGRQAPTPGGSLARGLARHVLAITFGLALLSVVGCSLGSGTLGGRERCWPEGDPRAASLWRGILRVDATGGRLETPEGEVIPLKPGALRARVGDSGLGELVRGAEVVAGSGDDVTLFGGAGSDGALVVCAVEEVHSAS